MTASWWSAWPAPVLQCAGWETPRMPPDYRPGPVPREALDFFRAKGWKVGFDYRDVWRQEHATAFTVAKVMRADVLLDIPPGSGCRDCRGEDLSPVRPRVAPHPGSQGLVGAQVPGGSPHRRAQARSARQPPAAANHLPGQPPHRPRRRAVGARPAAPAPPTPI